MSEETLDLTFGTVREADLDLLLMQQLVTDVQFRSWFVRSAGLGLEAAGKWTCRRDVHRTGEGTGQTDLLLEIERADSGLRDAILIEDKVDAAFSDRTRDGRPQAERYRAHGEAMRRTGRYGEVRSVLVAPRAYVNPGFDAHVALEDIAATLASAVHNDPMKRFFDRFICAALGRHATGWQREIHPGVSSLWQRYGKIAQEQYPDLQMRTRETAPGDSYTASFNCLTRVDGLPACRIDHVMELGNVDILVPGLGHARDDLFKKLKPTLPSGVTFRAAGKSLGVNIRVPPITRLTMQPDLQDRVLASLNAARVLKQWFEQNCSALASAARD